MFGESVFVPVKLLEYPKREVLPIDASDALALHRFRVPRHFFFCILRKWRQELCLWHLSPVQLCHLLQCQHRTCVHFWSKTLVITSGYNDPHTAHTAHTRLVRREARRPWFQVHWPDVALRAVAPPQVCSSQAQVGCGGIWESFSLVFQTGRLTSALLGAFPSGLCRWPDEFSNVRAFFFFAAWWRIDGSSLLHVWE